MPEDLDIHRLRCFVAVATELHFGRAAAKLYLAQQVVSREVQRLEDQLGTALFDRTTRRVALTATGNALLERARELLALHDEIRDEVLRGRRPLLVDVVGEGLTPHQVVQAARADHDDVQLVVRTSGGLGAALPALVGRGIDVAFGYPAGLAVPVHLESRPVRYEPLGLLLLPDHPLAATEAVPMAALSGMTVDASVGNPDAPEWTRLCVALLEAFGARPSAAHLHVVGSAETVRHLREEGVPILSHTSAGVPSGAVLRPLVEPVPLYPWRMLWHPGQRHPALAALQGALDRLIEENGWLRPPPDAWLPPDIAIDTATA